MIQGHSRWARARSPGIFWAGVGNRFVSNTIRHTPDMAIYGGEWKDALPRQFLLISREN